MRRCDAGADDRESHPDAGASSALLLKRGLGGGA